MDNSNSVKLALVGCGWISGNHIIGYKELFKAGCKEFEISACCDMNRERAEEKAADIAEFQGKKPYIFTSIDELIKANICECADVCVPHCFHHSAAIRLLDGDLHVLLEKPLGITIEASHKIIDAAKRNNKILALAENVRREITARSCVWLIKEKQALGNIYFANVGYIKYAPFDYKNPAFKWRASKLLTGGGMIMDSGAHFADMIQLLFGEPDEIFCTMDTIDKTMVKDAPVIGTFTTDVEDIWHAIIKFKNGSHVTWTYCRSLYHKDQYRVADYYGEKGLMRDLGWVFHPFQGGGEVYFNDGTVLTQSRIQEEYLDSLTEERKNHLFPYGVTNGFAIEVYDFVRAISKNIQPEMDGFDAIKAKALCESCYESATINAPVKYQDVLNGKITEYQKSINDFWFGETPGK